MSGEACIGRQAGRHLVGTRTANSLRCIRDRPLAASSRLTSCNAQKVLGETKKENKESLNSKAKVCLSSKPEPYLQVAPILLFDM